MHRNFTKRNSGFTLVEILIVGTVVFVLLGGMTVVLGNVSQQIWTTTEPRLVALTDAQRALDRVSEDLRSARLDAPTVMCPPAAAGACTAPPCLVLRPAPLCPSCPTFPCPACPARVTYMRDGANLVRLQGDVTQVVASGLPANGFTPNCQPLGEPPGLVQLQVRAEVATPRGPTTQTFNSNVWVRSPQ